jgi:hypothetical protein
MCGTQPPSPHDHEDSIYRGAHDIAPGSHQSTTNQEEGTVPTINKCVDCESREDRVNNKNVFSTIGKHETTPPIKTLINLRNEDLEVFEAHLSGRKRKQ